MFRVLALDGGGIKGAYTAAVIAEYEAILKKPLASYFDLIVGTSTGGILALALANGLGASEIVNLYVTKASKIFPSEMRSFIGWFQSWFDVKYDSSGLRRALENEFGSTKLSDLDSDVAITSFEAVTGRPVLLRSKRLTGDDRPFSDMSLVEAALASSAAPTYFLPKKMEGRVLLDGGIWANCPVLVAISEAVNRHHCSFADINVLSIGTTTEPFWLESTVFEGGKLSWAADAVTLFMRASKRGAIDMGRKLCNQLLRIDQDVAAGKFSLDSAESVQGLVTYGRQSAEDSWADVSRFLGLTASKRDVGA